MKTAKQMRDKNAGKVRVPRPALALEEQQSTEAEMDDLEQQIVALKSKLAQSKGSSRPALRERGVLRNQIAGLDTDRADLAKRVCSYDSDDDDSVEKFYKYMQERNQKVTKQPVLAAVASPAVAAEENSVADTEHTTESSRKVWRGSSD